MRHSDKPRPRSPTTDQFVIRSKRDTRAKRVQSEPMASTTQSDLYPASQVGKCLLVKDGLPTIDRLLSSMCQGISSFRGIVCFSKQRMRIPATPCAKCSCCRTFFPETSVRRPGWDAFQSSVKSFDMDLPANSKQVWTIVRACLPSRIESIIGRCCLFRKEYNVTRSGEARVNNRR